MCLYFRPHPSPLLNGFQYTVPFRLHLGLRPRENWNFGTNEGDIIESLLLTPTLPVTDFVLILDPQDPSDRPYPRFFKSSHGDRTRDGRTG